MMMTILAKVEVEKSSFQKSIWQFYVRMGLIRQIAIRNKLLYSDFVLPNVQIFFVQKISFATFGLSIDDFFTRYAGLGYSLFRI